jgi:hypothetical protein
MSVQLDIGVMCKKSKKEGSLLNFYEFWSEEVHYVKKAPNKENFDV